MTSVSVPPTILVCLWASPQLQVVLDVGVVVVTVVVVGSGVVGGGGGGVDVEPRVVGGDVGGGLTIPSQLLSCVSPAVTCWIQSLTSVTLAYTPMLGH